MPFTKVQNGEGRAIRVLHVITGLQSGGAEAMLYKLLATMDRAAVSSVVLSLTPGGEIAPKISSLGIPRHELRMKGLAGGVAGIRRSVALIRAVEPDVIQTWLHHADLFGLVAGTLAGKRTIAWNIRCSSLSPSDFPQSKLRLVKALGLVSAIPKVVIANSEAGKTAHLEVGYHPRRWEVIPNGFDTTLYSPDRAAGLRLRTELGIDENAGVVGIVARYHPMKGHAVFLRAAAMLVRSRPDVRFLMVGTGVDSNNAELARRISELELQSHVKLLGERKDIPAVMNALDILTSASTSGEGFSNVLGEAMASGVPCVGTSVGDTREIIGETGLVVSPGDPDSLADAWDKLLAMSVDDRRSLGNSARLRIQRSYEIGVVAARYQQLYQELAHDSKRWSEV